MGIGGVFSYEASLFLKYWISLSKRIITIRRIQSMAEKHSKEVFVVCLLGDAMQSLPEVWDKGIEVDVLDWVREWYCIGRFESVLLFDRQVTNWQPCKRCLESVPARQRFRADKWDVRICVSNRS